MFVPAALMISHSLVFIIAALQLISELFRMLSPIIFIITALQLISELFRMLSPTLHLVFNRFRSFACQHGPRRPGRCDLHGQPRVDAAGNTSAGPFGAAGSAQTSGRAY